MMRPGVGVIVAVCAGLVGCGSGSSDSGKAAGPRSTSRVAPPDYPIPPAPPRVEAGTPATPRDGVAVEVPGAVLVGGKIEVFVRVAVVVPDREIAFHGWRGGAWVRLIDDLGTIHKPSPAEPTTDAALAAAVRTRFGAGVEYGAGPVRLGRPRVDVLVYEPPSATAAYLDLDLDGRDLGSADPFLFRIPRAMWQPTPPAPTRPIISTRRN